MVMVENLRRFWAAPVPDGFMGFCAVFGFIALVILAIILVIVTVTVIYALKMQRRARKQAEEAKISPEAAYRQILDQEKLIAEFDKKSEAEQVKRRRILVEKLVKSQGEFIKNFPWANQEALRKRIEDASSASR